MTEVRTNGFEWPLHPAQLGSWIVFCADVIVVSLFVIPLLPATLARAGACATYFSIVAVAVAFTAKATWTDPQDPLVSLETTESKGDLPFCHLCRSSIHPQSKHCAACDKCVHVFDHHCIWLNNCVGERNYRSFAISLSSVSLMTVVILGCAAFLLADLFSGIDETPLKERALDHPIFMGTSEQTALGILIGLVALNLPLFCFSAQLIFLHLFLLSQGLTTYEYIVNKNRLEQRKLEEDNHAGSGKRTLPRVLDWIVFKPRRKRPQQKGGSPEPLAALRESVSRKELPVDSLQPLEGDGDVGDEATPTSTSPSPLRIPCDSESETPSDEEAAPDGEIRSGRALKLAARGEAGTGSGGRSLDHVRRSDRRDSDDERRHVQACSRQTGQPPHSFLGQACVSGMIPSCLKTRPMNQLF